MSRKIEEVFVSPHGERISIEQFDYEPNTASAYNEIIVDAEGAVKLAMWLLELAGWQPMETAPRDGTKILVVSTMGYIMTARWEDIEDMEEGNPPENPQPVCAGWLPLPKMEVEK